MKAPVVFFFSESLLITPIALLLSAVAIIKLLGCKMLFICLG